MINRVKEERKKHKLTQEDLAFKVGVSRQSINAIETGKYNPSVILALKISVVLEKTVNELFEIELND